MCALTQAEMIAKSCCAGSDLVSDGGCSCVLFLHPVLALMLVPDDHCTLCWQYFPRTSLAPLVGF